MTQKQTVVNEFIKRINEIEPLAKVIQGQKKILQEQLNNIKTFDEIDKIEDEIIKQNKAISTTYDKLISYPTNENEAGELIDYLEKNRDLLKIMQTFDFHESLMDDLLNARARLTEEQES